MRTRDTNPIDIEQYLADRKRIIDGALDRILPLPDTYPSSIHQAMRYSVLGDGKRFRPILACAVFEAMNGTNGMIMEAACALELIHAYSLIHDDLPCMDDDDLRRGKPTLHKAFNEAVAVLAGDALSALAFELLAATERPDIIREVARAIGPQGMVGGQVVDIQSEGKPFVSEEVEYIHSHKTGALITVAARVGAMLAGAGPQELSALTVYGEKMGLAFQIVDDILDLEGKLETLGKKPGSDLCKKKATYPSVVGLEESKKRAEELIRLAIETLSPFGAPATPLQEIARFILTRTY